MNELDERHAQEIVKNEIAISKISERVAVIESMLANKADKSDIEVNFQMEWIKGIVDSLKDLKKTITKVILKLF